MLEKIDFKDGKITFDNLLWLTEQDFKKEREFFGEDLLQVHYSKNYILDIEWYNIFSKQGTFIVKAVKDMAWDNPLFKTEVSSLKELKRIIEICIKVIYKDKMK